MSGRVPVAVLVLAFALLVTCHVLLAVQVARRGSGRRALVGFVAPPLLPYLAWRAGVRGGAVVWSVAALLYLGALAVLAR